MPRLTKKLFLTFILISAVLGGLSLLDYLPSISLANLFDALPNVQVPPLLPDGTLIRSDQNEQVYLLERGMKRWIDSPETFRTHGLRAERITTLTTTEINRYPEGENITAQSHLVLLNERDILPDLAPLAPYDIRLAKLGGRTVLRFTGSLWNKGKQPLYLTADSSTHTKKDHPEDVYQRIIGADGLERSKLVGTLFWHGVHNHYHYNDFANYVFQPIRMTDGSPATMIPATTQKTTFCLRDDHVLDPSLPNAPLRSVYHGCGLGNQGVSVGWVDVYPYTLPDQYIDVEDMPPGVYALSFFLDPNQRFVEERTNNNISTTFLELDYKKGVLKIIASIAPFTTSANRLPDDMLISSGGDSKIYVIHNNKKRWIQSAEIFASYNYPWDKIYILTQGMIDSIPNNNLVRLIGTEEVYSLNDLGYKRHITNLEVFRSYSFDPMDIANINSQEFASYHDSTLIRLVGDGDIYLINGSSKKDIGKLSSLQSSGYDLNAIQTVNQTDFDSYTTLP